MANATTDAALPTIVSPAEWSSALDALRVREKDATRARDALNAERRRLPMLAIEKDYRLMGPEGEVGLLELFAGHRQLVIYHFMFGPGWDEGCVGCSMMVDNMGHPAHLNARGVSRVLVSRAPLPELLAYKARMGWSEPWYSSFGTDFNADFGATVGDNEIPRLSVLLRDGDRIFLTYQTGGRGLEHLGPNWSFLDLTPFGRQEPWEESPAGRPQSAPYAWWRRHDRYDTE